MANAAVQVTPSDTADLPFVAQRLFVSHRGDLRITTTKGDTVTLGNVLSGTFVELDVKRVLATGTNALGIVAFGTK